MPQIVGNLVYYRYMNPAVVAPDGFGVVDRSAGSALQPEQRHLLGSIARMLQHAAANKHFHGDGYHVRALNHYISATHHKFRCGIQFGAWPTRHFCNDLLTCAVAC